MSSIYSFVPQKPLVCVEPNPGPPVDTTLQYAKPGQKWVRKSLSGGPLIARPPVNLLQEVINEEKEEKKEIKKLKKKVKKVVKPISLLGKRKRKGKKNKKNKKKKLVCPQCGCNISQASKKTKKKTKKLVTFGPQTKKQASRARRRKLLKQKKKTAWVASAPRGFFPQSESFYGGSVQSVPVPVQALPQRDNSSRMRRRAARALRQRNLSVAQSLV